MRGGSGGVSFVGVDTADLDRRSAGAATLSLSLGDDGGGSALGAPGDLALAAAEGEDGGGVDSGIRGGLEDDEVRRGRGGWG